MKTENYKENLLTNARFQVERAGGKVRIKGNGNNRKVCFQSTEGRIAEVWFPVESRVKDLEIADLKEAIREFSGSEAFTI